MDQQETAVRGSNREGVVGSRANTFNTPYGFAKITKRENCNLKIKKGGGGGGRGAIKLLFLKIVI